MTIVVSARHMDMTPAMKAHAEEKANRLTQYYDLIQEIEVIYTDGKKDHGGMNVEIIVNAEHKETFVARHADPDAYTCVNACVEKLKHQLTDHKKKHRNRKHPEGEATSIRHGEEI